MGRQSFSAPPKRDIVAEVKAKSSPPAPEVTVTSAVGLAPKKTVSFNKKPTPEAPAKTVATSGDIDL
jgi:hypothetical protein